MNKNIMNVVELAGSMRGTCFATRHYGASPYCASFVRYVFEEALGKSGEFPIVGSPPYYQRMGIRNPPGKWFADSLAGDEVGQVVALAAMQPGDLIFYRDTYSGPFPKGSITHVGICVGANGKIADARSGGIIHIGHYSEMSGEVIEVRRPRCLNAGDAGVQGAKILLRDGKAEAVLDGRHVRRLEINLTLNQTLSVSVNQKHVHPQIVEMDITPSQALLLAGFGGGRAFQDHLKLHSHNGISRALFAGADVKQLNIKAVYDNFALHIWVNGQETRAASANISLT